MAVTGDSSRQHGASIVAIPVVGTRIEGRRRHISRTMEDGMLGVDPIPRNSPGRRPSRNDWEGYFSIQTHGPWCDPTGQPWSPAGAGPARIVNDAANP
jgi:hypothetical protein